MGAKEEEEVGVEKIEGRLLKLDMVTFGRVTVSLPSFSLLFCFVSAVIFQYDQINDTQCGVENYLPSISAITGISPQRYVWRLCIGLHSTPRFFVGMIYYNYFTSRLHLIKPSQRSFFKILAVVCLCTYSVENFGLTLVAFVSNVENYDLHEKIFIMFMVCSCFHQVFHIVLFQWSHPEINQVPKLKKSLLYKKTCFVIIMTVTCLLLYFFMRHRWYCEPGAFTFFALMEYAIAYTNIAFHYTATIEFENLYWYVGLPSCKIGAASNGTSARSTNGTHGSTAVNNNHCKHE